MCVREREREREMRLGVKDVGLLRVPSPYPSGLTASVCSSQLPAAPCLHLFA